MNPDGAPEPGEARIAALLRDVTDGPDSLGPGRLAGVSLVLPEGGVTALIGPPCSGRGRLIALVAGEVRGFAGTALVLGQPCRPDRAPPRAQRRLIGHVGAEPALVAASTVRRNVLCGRLGHRPVLAGLLAGFREEDEARADVAMVDAGVATQAAARAGSLPEAARRRVALARALAQDPRLLLLEEGAGGSEPRGSEAFLKLAAGIARRRNLTLLLAVRDPPLALRLADRVVAMRDGQVVRTGPPRDFTPAFLDRLFRGRTGEAQPHLRLVV